MASAKSRNQRDRKDEDHDFRKWRSPHQKSSAADHFRYDGNRRDSKSDHSMRENDRNGTHRTRYRHDRESKPHRWSSDRHDRRAEPRSKKPNVYSSSEFPPLGAKDRKETNMRSSSLPSSYTPDSIRTSSQSYISTSSSHDWASQIEQFEKDKERALRDMMRYKRRLLMSESSDGSNEDQENMIDMSAQPKKQYETDETVIVRRQKQIELGKNTLGYDQYLQQIPKYKRVKNVHIVTPNKFLKCSRRAWDGLIRQWRRQLHDYDPEGTYKPQRVARKELHFSDTNSEATSEGSSEQDARMDVELNSSISSAISDYLASNESSRPETPDNAARPETPTTELKELTVSDQVNGNYQTGEPAVTAVESIPEATLTPSVTPADHEGEGHGPQVNPSDLIAALHHAAQVAQPPVQAAFYPGMYGVSTQPTSSLNPHFASDMSVHSFHRSHDNDMNPKMTSDTKKGDIFDNFNLDECFLREDDIIE